MTASAISGVRYLRRSARGGERFEPGFRQRRPALGAGERTQEGARGVAAPGRRGDSGRIDRRQLDRGGQSASLCSAKTQAASGSKR